MEGHKDSNKRYPMVAYGLFGTLTIRKTMKNQCHSPPAHWKASLAQNVNASMPGCPNRRTPDIFAECRLSPQLTFGWLLFHRILKNAVILSVMNNYSTIYNIHQHSIILTKQHLLSKKLTEKTQIYRILQQGSAKNFIIYRIYSHKMQPQATINRYASHKCSPTLSSKKEALSNAPWLPIAALGRSVGSWREWSNYQFPPWLRRHMSRHCLGENGIRQQKTRFSVSYLAQSWYTHVRWHLLQLPWFPCAWYTNCPMAFFL